MQKKLILGIAAAVIALGALGTGVIYAQSNITTDTGNSIVDRISERFELNKADVEQVFKDQRDEMMQKRQKMFEDKLTSLVSEGKLTEDQKTKLIAKLAERHQNKVEFKNLTKEEIKAKMDQEKADFDSWLKENNIDIKALGLNFGMRMRVGMGHNMNGGPWSGRSDDNGSTNSTQTQ